MNNNFIAAISDYYTNICGDKKRLKTEQYNILNTNS